MNKLCKKYGFTMLELMIVVAIIGILITILIPSYQIYIRRARYTEIVQAVQPYKLGVQECFQITSSLSDCHAGQNSIPAAVSHVEGPGLVQSIAISNEGTITVTPKSQYGITNHDTYILTPKIERGQLFWVSGGGGVSKGYAN